MVLQRLQRVAVAAVVDTGVVDKRSVGALVLALVLAPFPIQTYVQRTPSFLVPVAEVAEAGHRQPLVGQKVVVLAHILHHKQVVLEPDYMDLEEEVVASQKAGAMLGPGWVNLVIPGDHRHRHRDPHPFYQVGLLVLPPQWFRIPWSSFLRRTPCWHWSQTLFLALLIL